jgi:YebC/PmpR family DNA-binding regulatory protein
MSGHSKWSTIKRKKAATDAKRGQLFTKLLKEIQVSARAGGGSVESNFRLKTAVLAAKSNSVPQDNIERAIKRGVGDNSTDQYEEVTYEAYGPGGVALLIKVATDNKNRTVAEVRHVLSRNGGTLGSANSVAYLFTDKGLVRVPRSCDYEEVFELALNAGAEEVDEDDEEFWVVVCDAGDFENVRQCLEKLSGEVESVFQPVPEAYINLKGEEAEVLIKLIEALDDLDDVQQVISNFSA